MDAEGSPKTTPEATRKKPQGGFRRVATRRETEGGDEDDQRRTAVKMRKLFEKSIISEINKKLWRRKAGEKRYFLHYEKGKYNLVNLDLKKKGHDQKY